MKNCKHCKEPIHDQATKCHHCRSWQSFTGFAPPPAEIVGVVALLFVVLCVVVFQMNRSTQESYDKLPLTMRMVLQDNAGLGPKVTVLDRWALSRQVVALQSELLEESETIEAMYDCMSPYSECTNDAGYRKDKKIVVLRPMGMSDDAWDYVIQKGFASQLFAAMQYSPTRVVFDPNEQWHEVQATHGNGHDIALVMTLTEIVNATLESICGRYNHRSPAGGSL